MADQLRPYMFESSSSSPTGVADREEKGVLGGGNTSENSSGGGGDVPLLTVSDINPDMLEVRQSAGP